MVENCHKCLTLNFHAKNGQIEPLDLDVFIGEIHLRSLEATDSQFYLRAFEVTRGQWRPVEVTGSHWSLLEVIRGHKIRVQRGHLRPMLPVKTQLAII